MSIYRRINRGKEVTLPSIDKLHQMLVDDLKESPAEQAPNLILLHMNSAYRLGKEVRERELRADGKIRGV